MRLFDVNIENKTAAQLRVKLFVSIFTIITVVFVRCVIGIGFENKKLDLLIGIVLGLVILFLVLKVYLTICEMILLSEANKMKEKKEIRSLDKQINLIPLKTVFDYLINNDIIQFMIHYKGEYHLIESTADSRASSSALFDKRYSIDQKILEGDVNIYEVLSQYTENNKLINVCEIDGIAPDEFFKQRSRAVDY